MLVYDIGFLEGQLKNHCAAVNKINFVALIYPTKRLFYMVCYSRYNLKQMLHLHKYVCLHTYIYMYTCRYVY